MTDSDFYSKCKRYKTLKDYMDHIDEVYPPDYLEGIKDQDPGLYNEIQAYKTEFAELEFFFTNRRRQVEKNRDEYRATQIAQTAQETPDLFAAMPSPPKQTFKETLMSGTVFDPIVTGGYAGRRNGINWPHYENLIKLFTLDNYFILDEPTEQQKQDRAELVAAIEFVGNAHRKKKKWTAEQILDDATKKNTYIYFGERVINAMAKPNRFESEYLMNALNREISNTGNDFNAKHLKNIRDKSKDIFVALQKRYLGKENG